MTAQSYLPLSMNEESRKYSMDSFLLIRIGLKDLKTLHPIMNPSPNPRTSSRN